MTTCRAMSSRSMTTRRQLKGTPPVTDQNANDKYDVTKIIVLSGWSLTIAVCLVIIGAAVYTSLQPESTPGPLKEWAGMCLGFLLGSFVGLVKDFIKVG